MKKISSLLIAIGLCWMACDKINDPVKITNEVTVGTLKGTFTDIRVLNATTTADDVSILKATYTLVSENPRTMEVVFEWHGSNSNILSHTSTGNEVSFNNDSVYIAAPAPYGTLTFKYTASLRESATGEGDFVVPFTPASPLKKVMLEDFTGRKCGNCPRAQRIITNTLEPIFHEQLVSVTVHAGVYAIPEAPPSCFSDDFRDSVTTELNSFFGFNAYPSSLINRVDYPANHKKYYPNWQTIITAELNKPNDAYVRMYPVYNENTRTVNLTVSTEFLNQQSDDYRLAVYLVEDSLINCQLDYDLTTSTQVDSNYVHRHVVRKAVNSTFGENLIAGPALQTKYLRIYSYTLPANVNPDQCYMLAFVYRTSSYYILQSELTRIKQ
jgi:hypothetical protein